MKIKILHDVCNISKRIKYIDRDYYVVYNTSKQKFEIHNSSQFGSSYCLTLPYCQLDERALAYVRQTASANIDEVLEKMENDNNIRESANITSAFSSVAETIEQEMER